MKFMNTFKRSYCPYFHFYCTVMNVEIYITSRHGSLQWNLCSFRQTLSLVLDGDGGGLIIALVFKTGFCCRM
jgi:hypothetical protein